MLKWNQLKNIIMIKLIYLIIKLNILKVKYLNNQNNQMNYKKLDNNFYNLIYQIQIMLNKFKII